MCTVTWTARADGYHLLCNRDELHTRRPALAPHILERGGVRYIAPLDSEFGGTWIAVNEFGMSLCLLNGAPIQASTGAARRSRGLLLPELVWASGSAECALWLKQLDLGRFAPFTLLVLEPGQPALVADWDRGSLRLDPAADARMPLTSSSVDPAGVCRSRAGEFENYVGSDGAIDPAALYRFHSSHGPRAGAYSACMHRDDAATVSFSWAIVTGRQVRFLYSPGAPCQWSPTRQQILARAA